MKISVKHINIVFQIMTDITLVNCSTVIVGSMKSLKKDKLRTLMECTIYNTCNMFTLLIPIPITLCQEVPYYTFIQITVENKV